MAREGVAAPCRGDIYLVNFDPTIGAEIKKTRPALIIQNDIANEYSPVTIVAAITSAVGGKSYPTEVPLEQGEGGLERSSTILLNQLRTIDKSRLVKRLGAVREGTLSRVNLALRLSLALAHELR